MLNIIITAYPNSLKYFLSKSTVFKVASTITLFTIIIFYQVRHVACGCTIPKNNTYLICTVCYVKVCYFNNNAQDIFCANAQLKFYNIKYYGLHHHHATATVAT